LNKINQSNQSFTLNIIIMVTMTNFLHSHSIQCILLETTVKPTLYHIV